MCSLNAAARATGATRTIGASGAIYGLLLAFGVCYPNQTVLMNFLFPIKAKYMVMIYAGDRIADVGRREQRSQQYRPPRRHGGRLRLPEIAHSRACALKLPDWRGAYRQWKLQRAKKKFQVYMKKHDRGPWVN